jgi:hypothetical protein
LCGPARLELIEKKLIQILALDTADTEVVQGDPIFERRECHASSNSVHDSRENSLEHVRCTVNQPGIYVFRFADRYTRSWRWHALWLLYRYPLKGFAPEDCDTLTVLGEGRIAGDLVLGIRFADTEAPDDNWSKKHGMLALINTPGLARLRVTFDAKASRLRISLGASLLVDDG